MIVAPAAADEPLPAYASMKLLFCAYGGVRGITSLAESEDQFATAVVEVNNGRKVPNAPLPKITLLGDQGKFFDTIRVISVEVFDEPFEPGEGNGGFYLSSDPRGHTHAWDGTLPTGMVHLRVHVALPPQSRLPIMKSCRVSLGPYAVEGPVDEVW